MPFIHVRAHSGRDLEAKKKMAQAIVKAAADSTGLPETAFTLAYDDIEPAKWEKDVAEAIVEPMRDKVLINLGKPV